MNNYLDFEQGEITIYCGKHARHTAEESLKQAAELARHCKVLYINTVFSVRGIRALAKSIISKDQANLTVRTMQMGELGREYSYVKAEIERTGIKCVIINGWEYACDSYVRKTETIFWLMGMRGENVSLLIYSQASAKKAEAGKIAHGGLGKLAGVAVALHDLVVEEAPSVQEENKKLLPNKINELTTAHEPPVVQESEEAGGGVFSVNEGGLVSHNARAKHLPMSNTNRKLLADYEKLHGKAQLPGESFRDMFDRVVGRMIAERAGMREMMEA
jgi:hypothetical protein